MDRSSSFHRTFVTETSFFLVLCRISLHIFSLPLPDLKVFADSFCLKSRENDVCQGPRGLRAGGVYGNARQRVGFTPPTTSQKHEVICPEQDGRICRGQHHHLPPRGVCVGTL